MHNAIYILNTDAYDKIYGAPERADIDELVTMVAPQQTAESIAAHPELLADVDVVFSGWGMARLDEGLLAAAPNLEAVFYSAGSIRGFATDASWDRGIIICSAWAANAVPVSEYTLAQILFSLKRGWHHALTIRREQRWTKQAIVPGAYCSTVGIISLGMIGRLVVERLRPFDIRIIAYDPFVSEGAAADLGAELCSLEDVFKRADVVSLHTPKLPETLGMITGAHLASMKEGTTFINTARGAVVRETEMVEVLQVRSDLFAILDVTDPEPPVDGSPLYTLPNVILTPHIAGSIDTECRRMARYMIDDYRRYLAGEPLLWEVSREKAETLA